jgi:hypothetical protein
MFKKAKYFLLGVIATVIFMAGLSYAEEEYYHLKKMACSISVNDEKIKLDMPVLNYEGKAYLPLRKVAELTGAIIDWNADTKVISISVISTVEKKLISSPIVQQIPTIFPTITSIPTPIPTVIPVPVLTPTITTIPTSTPTPFLPIDGIQITIPKNNDSTEIKNTIEEIVYITKTGSKYHRVGCRYLGKNQIPINLSDAKRTYAPCSVCNP